jgi:iron complex transport system ATP-binding protein
MSPLLQAASITVSAGAKRLLGDIGLTFERGESVALIGPNGAGKSTLLRVLSGDLAPQSGRVRLHGRDLSCFSPHQLALHRAVLSQTVGVAFAFTAADVMRMGAPYARENEVRELVETTLAELDLGDFADRAITTLSGGERQRVHFARVLVQLAHGRHYGGGDILLLDEPTAGLDLRHQLAMMDAVRRRTKDGVLAIAVHHDLNLAALFASRVIVLDGGRIGCDGRPDETITDKMLRRVFGIATTVGQVPAPGMPFVLPQNMMPARTDGRSRH